MAADLVTIATTAALTQFVGPMFKHLGEQALERAKQIASTAAAQLKAVGREPQPVEPKLLVPLVQAASLETDEALAAHWAALLANAADPAQRVQVQPGFTEILRQLTTVDALVLEFIVKASEQSAPHLRTYAATRVLTLHKQLEGIAAVDQINIAVDNIERLGLCRTHGTEPPQDLSDILSGAGSRKQKMALHGGLGKEQMFITHLGLAFLAAVTPPAL